MTLKLSDDETALRDSLREFLVGEAGLEYVRRRFNGTVSSDDRLWEKLTGLGLFDLFADGEGSVRHLALIAYETGRALLPENLLDTLLWRGPLGREVTAALSAEAGGQAARFTSAPGRAGCCAAGDGKLDGEFRFVPAADVSTTMMVVQGAEVLAVDLRGAGVTLTEEPALDGTIRRFTVQCSGSPFRPVVLPGNHAARLLAIMAAAELAGVSGRAVEMTTDYVKTRRQFDVPVGGFQAVQHRLAELHLQSEALKALVRFAAWSADLSPEQLPLAAPAALLQACAEAPGIVEGAIQLHGGIGFTWEYDLHFFLRRARTLEALHRPAGSDQAALVRVVAAGG